jgi:hypothetical protein
LILINANERHLGFDTKLFGQFWSAQIYRAGMTRFDLLKRGKRITPCWVFLDEAQTYITDDLMFGATLDKLREAKISVLAAMHYLQQIDSLRVRSAIDTNTAIKFSAIPQTDWHWQCDAPRFSGKVRFPFVDFQSLPEMTPGQKREVIELSRSQFGSQAEEHPAPPSEEPAAETTKESTDERGGLGPL